jgi:hypothetical protein
MLYRNKNIRALYSFSFKLFIVGISLGVLALFIIICGFISGTKTYGNDLWKRYDMYLITGGILFITALILIITNVIELINSRKVTSLSNITADEIDKEADDERTVWFGGRIAATPSLLVGFTSEIGNLNYSQTAFRYNEIKRLYGYNKTHPNSVQPYNNRNRYRIVVEATDGNKYMIYDVLNNSYISSGCIEMMKTLYNFVKGHNPSAEYGPEDIRYKTFKFLCSLTDGDNEYAGEYKTELNDEMRKDICISFDKANVLFNYSSAEDVFSIKMEFVGDREVEVKAGYLGESEKIIEETLYDFLKKRMKKGIYTEEFCVGFKEIE